MAEHYERASDLVRLAFIKDGVSSFNKFKNQYAQAIDLIELILKFKKQH